MRVDRLLSDVPVLTQILYGELEAALRFTQEKLETTNLELEKQKTLNEKLEIDLLSMNTANTEIASDPGRDLLTGLERSRKSPVSLTQILFFRYHRTLPGILNSVNSNPVHVSG